MTGAAGEPPTRAVPSMPFPKRLSGWAELGPRLASGLVLMCVALAVTVFGGWPFDLFWLLAGLAIAWEWQGLIGGTRHYGRLASQALFLAGATLLAVQGLPAYSVAVLAAGAIVSGWSAPRGTRVMVASGLLYAGALTVSVCLLRNSVPDGTAAMVWLFAVVWGTDSMAFFGGRLIGGPKLAPGFSPSKTWSGFAVGVVSGSLFGWAVSPQGACSPCMVALGLLAGASAQVGDLFESALKRRSGVKDASGLIPGHGGVMDRLDGFIAASLFAACLGAWRLGVGSAGAGLFNW